MKKNFLRTALIGCGTIAPNHLNVLTKTEGIEIAALCDIDASRAEARKSEYGLDSKIYSDYTAMLENERLDAVHIATPHYLHAEMAIAALKRNINVLSEKPMCINEAEINALISAEEESKAGMTVCFQNRYSPAVIKAKEIAENDGGVISAYGSVFWERDEHYYTDSGWRGKYTTEGGGVLINQAIHTLDLLCEFLGKPKKVWATAANHHLKSIIEVEDSAEGMILFESGKYANFYATTAFHGYDSVNLFLKTENHKIEIRNYMLFLDGESINDAFGSSYIGKEVYGNGHESLIKDFYGALKKGRPLPVSIKSAQYALKILLAAYRSNDKEIII